MSRHDPEEQNVRTQAEAIDFSLRQMAMTHGIVCVVIFCLIAGVGAPIETLAIFVLAAFCTFPLPLVVAAFLGYLVHSAFRAPLHSTKQMVRVLILILEMSLFGWFLLALMDSRG